MEIPAQISIGIDVGSTTAKIVALHCKSGEIVHADYRRHHAQQIECVDALLSDAAAQLQATYPQVVAASSAKREADASPSPNKHDAADTDDSFSESESCARNLASAPNSPIVAAVTGSGGAGVARALNLPFVQEVVAGALAISEKHPETRCAIELGGQDAKMIFFSPEEGAANGNVSDMRMNGSCAGGTGAFLDEIASILSAPVEELNGMAEAGKVLHSISGRCGVFAKMDIQPLLNQGASREDIALSSFHAVAKQTIGGLAQGLDIHAPVLFQGGPLTFNPKLVSVFKERLDLDDDQVIIPQNPEVMVAFGAALYAVRQAGRTLDFQTAHELLEHGHEAGSARQGPPPLLATDKERTDFYARHTLPAMPAPSKPLNAKELAAGQPLRRLPVYLGIDAGSTTTKFVLLDEEGALVDSFYSSNEGEPLKIAQAALLDMNERYRAAGIQLDIGGAGSTGYGELLFAHAFHCDYHTVETVAHAKAASAYRQNVSFILDIGGQDMKAIWMKDGIITDILMNEACSSGCGSFLENFASALGVTCEQIADIAFSSEAPAALGSRCTVFMNSNIVTEQRNGKTPADIMAGLCTSIIENVFNKVIRITNLDTLGDDIVVQGGTFANDAVLAAFERYVGKPVTRAPYPGLMGAIGAALLTQEKMREQEEGARHEGRAADALAGAAAPAAAGTANSGTSFIGFDELANLTYTQTTDLVCPLCANHCNRTQLVFSNGQTWVTGQRCERGAIVGDPHDEGVKSKLRALEEARKQDVDLFKMREDLLFGEWPYPPVAHERNVRIGLPRVLALWNTAPFWRVLFESLGFTVVFSHKSTRAMFEEGLPYVTSDTICFPAKLVHGHVRDLVKQGVDRIFMPSITAVSPEGTSPVSESMCAVVKGYPIVMRNSDNPATHFGVPFDTPLFHWHTTADRDRQLTGWLADTFGIDKKTALAAMAQADEAQAQFRTTLQRAGATELEKAQAAGRISVVLASRPYHNDALVNHDLPRMFAEYGVKVLPPDAVPGVFEEDLSNSRIDVVNNYHARMLTTAAIAARTPLLEYAQIVSFGCGHDAYLSDEIVRIMDEISESTPLILKVDETPIEGPLRIRVRSFVETAEAKRKRAGRTTACDMRPAAGSAGGGAQPQPRALQDPYSVKFTKDDRATRTVLVPNTSHAFSRLMATAFAGQGLRTESLPIGRDEAIRLGKKYVHNDICFPAQIVIGEALCALESGKYDDDEVAIGMGKYIGDCRLTHYVALLRKALDDAGHEGVPIISNDDVDAHDVHPGFKMNLLSASRIAFALPMIDALEDLLRKMRPYETVPGSAEAAFDTAIDQLMDGLESGGIRGMKRAFHTSIATMRDVPYDRSDLRPRVLIVGEYLLNFHPGANHDIEKYLEANGFEVVQASMTDVIRKTYFYQHAQHKEYHLDVPAGKRMLYAVEDNIFEVAHDTCDAIAKEHPLYEPPCRMPELVQASDAIFHHTFDAGEGVLIPAEVLHHAANGVEAFVILQPFGCLPNHVVGRGIMRALKDRYPKAHILPLDYDPDVSFANIENRLQMLVMQTKGTKRASRSDDPSR